MGTQAALVFYHMATSTVTSTRLNTVEIDPVLVSVVLTAYQVLPSIIELWGLNVETEVESKKT